ncbi:hypothetical protein BZG36_05635, partial [Bifiguratus adelaidae]
PSIGFPHNPVQSSCLPQDNQTLDYEVMQLSVLVPARLALIAGSIGRNDLINQIVSILEQSFAYWLTPRPSTSPSYETNWGGFINTALNGSSWSDINSVYYNDRHFCYGYLLYGASVIGRYDSGWLSKNLDFLTQAARDIGNPSPNDPYYTVTRHMDWFAGHSWASGLMNDAGSHDQEISGEAINGYCGLNNFAHVTNNHALIDYSRMLIAIEQAGARSYWHLYPDTPYPEQAFRALTTLGAWLFWGSQHIQIAATQMLPLTPIGELTYDPAWLQSAFPYCLSEIQDPTIGGVFKSVIVAAYSVVNPQSVYNYSLQLSDWDTGNSATNTLYLIATRSSSSDICTSSTKTPIGEYYIQDVASGQYLTGSGNLAASAATTSLTT